MANDIKFDALWQIWQKERKSSMLQQVDRNFYHDAMEFYDDVKRSEDQDLKTNLIKILTNIIELRKGRSCIRKAGLPRMWLPMGLHH